MSEEEMLNGWLLNGLSQALKQKCQADHEDGDQRPSSQLWDVMVYFSVYIHQYFIAKIIKHVRLDFDFSVPVEDQYKRRNKTCNDCQ